ncbi:SAM-dependent methyltransferase [Vibrio sp. 11986-1-5]|nr:SAM-dependent methyltransferase [Vibrio sp. 11986-1-5]
MNQFLNHNHTLRYFFEKNLDELDVNSASELVDLDSIDYVLRKCLTIEEMREAGSFFTGQQLATEVLSNFQTRINFDSIVLDPTCGAGNLLIECSRFLDVEETLSITIERWGRVLCGYDIHESFIEAAKLRIVIEALRRGVRRDCSIDDALACLDNIKAKDVLNIKSDDLMGVTHVIANPPFTAWESPKTNYWKRGKVNSAGVVMDHLLRTLPPLCEIHAILPDVLRSGSRYQGFRNFVSSKMKGDCNIWGRFSSKADVDVFLLKGIYSENDNKVSWFDETEKQVGRKLGDDFDVCIGPLVGYRDPKEGPEHPYVHPKNAPIWETLRQLPEKRKFSGRVITGPFVVVKRTSSPTDRYRASATIIMIKEPIAVENHMIVIKPRDNTLRSCQRLMRILRAEATNEFLNQRIRLRHLTVGVVKEIPLD